MKNFCRIISLIVVICILLCGCKVSPQDNNLTTTEQITTTQIQEDDVIVSRETLELAKDTIEDSKEGENLESNEVILSWEEDSLEPDGIVRDENLSFNGTNSSNGLKLLGKYQGLTYYSQADSRWASIPYTSCNDKSQTIKSSGCGPTSAAIVISSSKGAIIPPTTAKLFKDNGFRTKSNGTAWSVWPFVADYFDFNEYKTTTNFNILVGYLVQDKDKDGVADYFAVASCGPGLFTTSGHYIALMGVKNETFTVYDPYYYVGKFNTPSRRAAKVKMAGNIAYVGQSNIKKYGNFKQFWIFSNDKGKGNPNNTTTKKKTTTKKQTTTQKITTTTKKTTIYKTKVGKKYKIVKTVNLYSKGTLKGTDYTYKKNTTVKVLKHYNTKVDYVQVISTGRKAYIEVKYLKELK